MVGTTSTVLSTIRKEFPVVRLNEEFINRFMQISNNATINEYLMNTLKIIRLVNWFEGTVFIVAGKDRNDEIDKFVANKNVALNWLIPIYNMTDKFPNYKDFIASDNTYSISKEKNNTLKADLLKKFKAKDILNP